MTFSTIILAAGKGTRMKSEHPKVLHQICGMPMIRYVAMAAREAGSEKIVVVLGHGSEKVEASLKENGISFALQREQLGTGHAVMMCEEAFRNEKSDILILCGDAPLIRSSMLASMIKKHAAEKNAVTVLTAEVNDPAGYGRIIKDGREIVRIIEEKDASEEVKKTKEINSGVYCVNSEFLFRALKMIGRKNRQGEYYLTDIIEIGKNSGQRVGWVKTDCSDEIRGVNSRKDLAAAEQIMRIRINDGFMDRGVTLLDPGCTYIDSCVTIGRDTIVYPQVRLEGETSIGEEAIIDAGVVIRDSVLENGVHIKPYSVITDSKIGKNASIGPFAQLRPGTVIKENAKIGNFVETKKATVGEGSKVNHLTYIGDAEIGRDVNIGAGTITCNYDGYRKFKTVIEDKAFVGSGSQLVAPVKIGRGSVIGAGSTITRDVPSDALSLTRSEQKTVDGWSKRKRGKKGGK